MGKRDDTQKAWMSEKNCVKLKERNKKKQLLLNSKTRAKQRVSFVAE